MARAALQPETLNQTVQVMSSVLRVKTARQAHGTDGGNAKVDTEAAPGVAGRYQIRSIPTLILFRGGREVARQAGAMSAADIVRWTQGNL